MTRHGIELDSPAIREFCHQWRIEEMCAFGSILRDDFGPASDIDLLVTFAEGADWSLLDIVAAGQALSALLGRRVDLVERRAVEKSPNRIRRQQVLGTAECIYASR
jgi:uncharacterized protein